MPTRECLPTRRSSWTQKARIGGHTFYLSCGEFADGRPGELWIEAAKAGTFSRGVLGALARVASVALQCGTPLAELVKALEGLRFPPDGPVEGSPAAREAASVADWVAVELRAAYLTPGGEAKVAGHTPEPWRSGA
jgi:ribonucleoside-diphosphate reductase alpha chain